MIRVMLKDGRCAELANGVCVSIEALDAGIACDEGRAHLLGHYTAAELRGFVVASPIEADGEVRQGRPLAGVEPVFDLG